MTMNERKIIYFEEGWEFIQKGITKLTNILEGHSESEISSEDYMSLYTTVYNMVNQKPPHDYSQQLYDKYKETFVEYLSSTVLPSLKEKQGESMLKELLKRWGNQKVMVFWLTRFFQYLNRYYIRRKALPGLQEVGLTCFRNLVYEEIKNEVTDTVISLIDQERGGEQIDQLLLKNVIDILVEIDMGTLDFYKTDFEEAMLADTVVYYSRVAANWIQEYSCPDYKLKVEECLKREKDRVSHYLHSSTEQKLLEKVRYELLTVYSEKLLEKEQE